MAPLPLPVPATFPVEVGDDECEGGGEPLILEATEAEGGGGGDK